MWDIVLNVLLLEVKSLTPLSYHEDELVFKCAVRSAVPQFMTRLSGVKSLVVVAR